MKNVIFLAGNETSVIKNFIVEHFFTALFTLFNIDILMTYFPQALSTEVQREPEGFKFKICGI